MRVIFLGTPEFAIPSLKKLLASRYEVCAVVTQPDRPAGRGRRIQASPVKLLAAAHGLPVHQPEKIRNTEHQAVLASYDPDFLVVVAFGQILPRWLLETARLAPVNVHASLLPRYRGAAPVNWAILNGERFTGVTTMWMVERMDAGPILMQQRLPLPESATAGEMAVELAHAGAELLVPTLDGIREGTLAPTPQDEGLASYAPRITKEMAPVSWGWDSRRIHDWVRGLNPWPLACTHFRGRKVRLLRSAPASDAKAAGARPGTFLGLTREGILVQCGTGVLEVLEVQLEGRHAVSGRDFANGARLRAGELAFADVEGG